MRVGVDIFSFVLRIRDTDKQGSILQSVKHCSTPGTLLTCLGIQETGALHLKPRALQRLPHVHAQVLLSRLPPELHAQAPWHALCRLLFRLDIIISGLALWLLVLARFNWLNPA